MAVPQHPMRALKGTQQGRDLMASVRSHKTSTKSAPAPAKPAVPKPRGRKYDDIIAAHAANLPKG